MLKKKQRMVWRLALAVRLTGCRSHQEEILGPCRWGNYEVTEVRLEVILSCNIPALNTWREWAKNQCSSLCYLTTDAMWPVAPTLRHHAFFHGWMSAHDCESKQTLCQAFCHIDEKNNTHGKKGSKRVSDGSPSCFPSPSFPSMVPRYLIHLYQMGINLLQSWCSKWLHQSPLGFLLVLRYAGTKLPRSGTLRDAFDRP